MTATAVGRAGATVRTSGSALTGLRVAVLERPHPPGHRGALVDVLLPALAATGADVRLVHAESGTHRLDVRPDWDLVVLKSGSAAALNLAAAAQAWGVPCVNTPQATRLTRDKLTSTAVLRRAGLPVPASWGLWSAGPGAGRDSDADGTAALLDGVRAVPGLHRVVVKAARGSQGVGVLWSDVDDLPATLAALPAGQYLVMADVPRTGDDLKVFVAGRRAEAILRPFPARDLAAKLGRPADVPADVLEATMTAGRALGLECFGCDFVLGPDGWALVDVNAFPGYKGVDAVPGVLEALEARVLEVRS